MGVGIRAEPALFRADAATQWFVPWAGKLWAGEGLRLAGCSSGTGIVRAGAVLRGDEALWRRFASGVRLLYVSIGMFCVRITPAVCRIAPNRTACDRFRSYSRVGRDRHSRVLGSSIWLSNFVSSLRDCAFLSGDPDGVRGDGWSPLIRKGTPSCVGIPFDRVC